MTDTTVTACEALIYAIGRVHATSDHDDFVYIPVNEFAERAVSEGVTSPTGLRGLYNEMLTERTKAKSKPLDPTKIEPRPQRGDRVRGVDLDNVVRVGELTGFFAWNPNTFTNERANLQLDDGEVAVVTTASLMLLKAAAR